MKFGSMAVVVVLVAIAPAAGARSRQTQPPPQCVDNPTQFSWGSFLFASPPQANGCSPAVAPYGTYIGQDPDPNVRYELNRNPAEGDPNMWR